MRIFDRKKYGFSPDAIEDHYSTIFKLDVCNAQVFCNCPRQADNWQRITT